VDDQPLYLFDKRFGDAAPELLEAYEPPRWFADDLFAFLEERPDWRWLIVGGARSGSAWHRDPLAAGVASLRDALRVERPRRASRGPVSSAL